MSGCLRVVSLDDPVVQPLLAGLTVEYERRYGASDEMTAHDAADFEAPDGLFLVLEEDGEIVAGGGLRRFDPETAEIKRMWTAAAHRRRGLGAAVVRGLARAARERGYARLRLQTGTAQPEALSLYEREGFERIVPYGRYRDDPRCVCFEKELDEAQ